MMNEATTQIRDLKIVLKDMEPYVKDPRFLRTGRKISNFSLLPREFWANWLLCVVGRHNTGRDLTIAEDPSGGDGVILEKKTKNFIYTEHIFIPEPKTGTQKTVEDLIVEAVEKKAKKGLPYARGKSLVVFSEAIGWWHPNRVGRRIEGIHGFNSVYAVGLERGDQSGYTYWLTQFYAKHSPSWKIYIDFNFKKWSITRIQ